MRLIMLTRRAAGASIEDAEAEPAMLEVEHGELTLVLDDGEELIVDLEEFMRAVAGEQAPAEVEAA